jgi:adiponectin receptor
MPLSKRSPPTAKGFDGPFRDEIHSDGQGSMLLGTVPKLRSSDQVPSWYAHNAFIFTGYRPVANSVRLCIQSLGYLHNETVNIYSHLIPAVLALLSNYSFGRYFTSRFPQASWCDEIVFHVYLTTSVICFGMSSTYHTLICHSEQYADLWGRLDYVAIVFQILGSFVSGIYIGFYCEPNLQKLYWTMVSARRCI